MPELYRPSEWLSEVVAKKFPYYPQMGDEVLFFKEGYQLYLDAVRQRKVYELAPSQITPWGKLNIKVCISGVYYFKFVFYLLYYFVIDVDRTAEIFMLKKINSE